MFNSPEPMPAPLPIWKKALFSGVVVTTLLLAGEGFCRLLPSAAPVEIAEYVARWDEDWEGEFWTLQPGPEVNRDGFRDRDHSLANPSGRWRIACLGDSVTMGYQIGRDETWSAVLERNLLRHDENIEVFNVAMLGWSARQERIAYEKFLRPYQVEDVVLGICLNDVAEMQNNVAPGHLPASLIWLNRHSALVKTVISAHAREIARVEELFERDGAAHVENGWKLLFEEILELRREVEEDGSHLTIVVFPFRFQVLAGAPPPVAQRRMAAFCEQHAIPLLWTYSNPSERSAPPRSSITTTLARRAPRRSRANSSSPACWSRRGNPAAHPKILVDSRA